jgi:hypothetical protein
MKEMNQAKNQIEAIESIQGYIERIRKNRVVIEEYYFKRDYNEMQREIHHLFEGIVWIEYAVTEMQIPFHKEEKDKYFNGISEAIELNDWLTVIDFISYGLMQYLRLIEETLAVKYNALTGGIR